MTEEDRTGKLVFGTRTARPKLVQTSFAMNSESRHFLVVPESCQHRASAMSVEARSSKQLNGVAEKYHQCLPVTVSSPLNCNLPLIILQNHLDHLDIRMFLAAVIFFISLVSKVCFRSMGQQRFNVAIRLFECVQIKKSICTCNGLAVVKSW